jgi:cytosine/adenosine deaminase-related metal-dependent hydrolase
VEDAASAASDTPPADPSAGDCGSGGGFVVVCLGVALRGEERRRVGGAGHVGTTADIRARAGATTRVVDAEGRLVIPGINDAHVHIGAWPP